MSSSPDHGAEAWLARARTRLQDAPVGPDAAEIGRVETVGDGVAMVTGLPGARLDELLRFEKGGFGYARVLDRDRIGCVVLDPGEIEAGDLVHRTGDVVRVPVGEGFLGRTVDPLGRPVDGAGPIDAVDHVPIERPAPAILERDLVTQPMQTGLLVVDTLFPLGRGQRELIIGDRTTGRTTLAVDTIINQRHTDVVCVYVAIGQKTSSVRRAIAAIEAQGAPDRCIFVVAAAASPPGLQWIAPFAGRTLAEYFRDR
ncbi:MAG: F0F1 ATP synthase subunit alpha, partial [Gemmatimonadota bacterium]